jgi:hypothetical protein
LRTITWKVSNRIVAISRPVRDILLIDWEVLLISKKNRLRSEMTSGINGRVWSGFVATDNVANKKIPNTVRRNKIVAPILEC